MIASVAPLGRARFREGESRVAPPACAAARTRSRPSRRRHAAGTLAAFLAGALFAAVALEAAVLLLVGEQPRFPRHVVGSRFGLRINEPGARYRHRSADVDVEFRINRQGMRADYDFAYAKPPGTSRIVSLGDSFTIGYEVAEHETFSSVLERELRARGLAVEVLNAGVSGYSNAEELLYLERELLRYDPDLVLVSFSPNDLVDNIRSGLFRLEGGTLVEASAGYVPGGRLGDWLNTNPLLGWLSERSNGFAFLKERLTLLVKQRVVDANVRNVETAAAPPQASGPSLEERLTAAIFERLYRATRERGIPLVIQSIPIPAPLDDPHALLDLFPLHAFDVRREGIVYLPVRSVLEPELGRTLLYHRRSHGHWTPAAHRRAGEALVRLVADELRPE
jgi:hypothetical protein